MRDLTTASPRRLIDSDVALWTALFEALAEAGRSAVELAAERVAPNGIASRGEIWKAASGIGADIADGMMSDDMGDSHVDRLLAAIGAARPAAKGWLPSLAECEVGNDGLAPWQRAEALRGRVRMALEGLAEPLRLTPEQVDAAMRAVLPALFVERPVEGGQREPLVQSEIVEQDALAYWRRHVEEETTESVPDGWDPTSIRGDADVDFAYLARLQWLHLLLERYEAGQVAPPVQPAGGGRVGQSGAFVLGEMYGEAVLRAEAAEARVRELEDGLRRCAKEAQSARGEASPTGFAWNPGTKRYDGPAVTMRGGKEFLRGFDWGAVCAVARVAKVVDAALSAPAEPPHPMRSGVTVADLAALLDGRLAPAERDRVLRALASDDVGRQVLAEAASVLMELEAGGAESPQPEDMDLSKEIPQYPANGWTDDGRGVSSWLK